MVPLEDIEFERFLMALDELPSGFQTGLFDGERYSVSVERPIAGRTTKVLANSLANSEFISFNLFRLSDDRAVLKPCEMPADKVVRFILEFETDKQSVIVE